MFQTDTFPSPPNIREQVEGDFRPVQEEHDAAQ